MSRFAEPDDKLPVVLAHCGCCGEQLLEGESVINFEGSFYCDDDCLFNAYGIYYTTLGEI